MSPASFSKKHLFVINPRSFLSARNINRVIAEIVRCFDGPSEAREAASGGVIADLPDIDSAESPSAIHISRSPRDAAIVIWKYMALVGAETPVRVYAIGGDGVAFCCLNGIVGLPNAEPAVVPCGTGSDKELISEMRNIAEQIKAPAIPAGSTDCGSLCALSHLVREDARYLCVFRIRLRDRRPGHQSWRGGLYQKAH
jgi:hypothetical protein